MRELRFRWLAAAVLILAGAALLLAQDWQTATTLVGVDFGGLTAAKKATALRLLRAHNCTCGCEMKIAECRVKDPACIWSKGVSETLVAALKSGKDENDTIAAVNDSKWGKGPGPPKLLDDPVTIPTADSPSQGPKDAVLTLVEFSDFQCPYCSKAVEKLNAVLKAYPTQIRLVFKQFPLDSHSQAALAAAAGIAAHRQGKFWPMHDAMFAHRTNLARPVLMAIAKDVGLDIRRFTADLDSVETKKAVAKDLNDGERAGVEGTPTVFIAGQRYNGSLEFDAIHPVLERELKNLTHK